VSFFLVFVLLFMIEPALYCDEGGKCALVDAGSFIMGVLVAGGLFLLDMGLLYMTLVDFFLPNASSDG
ncbi:MAG: hypothetical protein V1813_02985, partial [Candidatus Aenigmatarchaeota archaeon]